MINLKKFKKTELSSLEREIERLFELLSNTDPSDPRYAKISDEVKKLYPLKETDSKRRLSPDVMVSAATNLAGILLVLQYEHVHVMTSKAFSLVGKTLRS